MSPFHINAVFHNSVGIIAGCFWGHDTSRGRLYNEIMKEDELIALAAHEGYVISPRQLERWHKADLIPRPEVMPPLTFGGGNRSVYSDYIGPQVLAICRYLERKRNNDTVRFWLWLEDYHIALPLLKETICRLVPPLTWNLPRPAEKRYDMAEKQTETLMRHHRTRNQFNVWRVFLRLFRKPDERYRFLYIQMSLLHDIRYEFQTQQEDEESSPAELFSQALNVKALRFLPDDLTHDLEEMSSRRLLSLTRMNVTLEAATEEDLARARTRLEMMLPLLECLNILGYRFGPVSFAFFSQHYKTNALAQALFLVFFLHLEAKGYSKGMEQVFEAVRTNWPILKRGQAVRNALAQELPHVSKELLDMGRIAELTKVEIEAYKERLREVYALNREDLDAFWQRHPEWIEEG